MGRKLVLELFDIRGSYSGVRFLMFLVERSTSDSSYVGAVPHAQGCSRASMFFVVAAFGTLPPCQLNHSGFCRSWLVCGSDICILVSPSGV